MILNVIKYYMNKKEITSICAHCSNLKTDIINKLFA